MLVEFRVENFKSIRKEQVFSMVASKDNLLPDNIIDADGFRLLRSAAIYGANASGKSNFIRAINTVNKIVLESAKYGKDDELPISPFKFDSLSINRPSSFEISFIAQNIRYQYGFRATKQLVVEEWLFSYPHGSARRIFYRHFDQETSKDQIIFGSTFRGERKSLQEKTQPNMLLLSLGGYWNNELLSPAYEWLCFKLRTIYSGINIGSVTAMKILRQQQSDPKVDYEIKAILSLLRKADFAISNINVKEKEIIKSKIFELIKEEQVEQISKYIEMRPPLSITFIHKNYDTGNEEDLDSTEESEGTLRFFEFIGPLMDTVYDGLTVFVDEIDRSLHPLLTIELIRLMHNKDINRTNAQLIFTSHNPNYLEPDLLRRDQVWFMERDEYNSTRLYSLWEYKKKSRKGEPIQKGYLSGRYGAIPIIEKFTLNES